MTSENPDIPQPTVFGDIVIPAAPVSNFSSDSEQPRLHIEELYIRDFKSYAGNQKLGPFHKAFNAIVGANGSGKSNVIDALLFVFGCRAQRIRCKKVSVLIHKSDHYPNIQSCSVTVNFVIIKDKDKTYEKIPGSEFTVRRTAHKDGSSTYEVNDKRVHYKEVSQLLRKYGIDLEYNRFLILQGEIEMISMMKAKAQNEHENGLLEYLEDIIGTRRYVDGIRQLGERLTELEKIKGEKLRELRILEKEREDLEEPKNKALQHLELENKMTILKHKLLEKEIHDARLELKKAKHERKAAEHTINLNLARQKEIHSEKKQKENEIEELKKNLGRHLKMVEENHSRYKELERQDTVCRENRKCTKSKMERLSKILETENHKTQKMNKQAAIFRGETEELNTKEKKLLERKSGEEQKLNEDMKPLHEEVKKLRAEKKKQEAELRALEKDAIQKKAKVVSLQSDLDSFLISKDGEKEKLSTLCADAEKTDVSIEENTESLKTFKGELQVAKEELASLQAKQRETDSNEEALTQEWNAKNEKIAEIENSLNMNEGSEIAKAFMREKMKGRFAGVYGRLGNLGHINETYDVAMSTACGALDNIVTDTLDTAKECVKYLKDNDLGYTTFIALDKMQSQFPPHIMHRIHTPEDVPRLFDLIQVKDAAVLPAFYYAIRDTLVGNDLDQATRIAYQGRKHRVVTLRGEVIEMSGTMSGGGRVQKGRIGRSSFVEYANPQMLQELNAQRSDIQKELSSLRKHKLELDQQIYKITKTCSSLGYEVERREACDRAYRDSKHMLCFQIEQQKKKISEVNPEDKMRLEAQIESYRKSHESAASKVSEKESVIKSLEGEISSLSQMMNKVTKVLNKLLKEIDDVSEAKIKSEVNLRSIEKDIKKSEKKIADNKKELEGATQAHMRYKREYEELSGKAEAVLKKRNEAQEGAKSCEQKKEAASEAIHSLRKEEHKLKSEMIDNDNKIKVWEAKMREKAPLIEKLIETKSTLKLHELDGSELPNMSEEDIACISATAVLREISSLKDVIQSLNADLRAIEEYKHKDELCNAKQQDLDNTSNEFDRQKSYHDQLRKLRLEEFTNGFLEISRNVKLIYQMLTLGGDAELELVDKTDPFSKGVDFSVRPVKKSWCRISKLSGGEKTLSSLALVFALHHYRPTPFYIMDEIDAALDIKNVTIVSRFIQEQKNAQFIIVSLRNNMYEKADRLIGICKTDNCTIEVVLPEDDDYSEEEEEEDAECSDDDLLV